MKWRKRDMESKISYLEYYKTILERVSFCQLLLRKEYRKAKHTIHPHEVSQLHEWLKKKRLFMAKKKAFGG